MTTGQLPSVLHYIRQFKEAATPLDDGELLQRFVRHGDETAFADLVRRHGPMVLGVCRRVLGHAQEAEDAFQSTFLLLVRKARGLRRPDLLGQFLHGVAYRTALKARSLAARRRCRQRPLEDWPAPASEDEVVWRDLRPILDDAINRLPGRYRAPFILCYLQGLTYAEAARQLGCPAGTLSTRLARARACLRKNLSRRGLALSAGLLAAVLAGPVSATVPPDWLAGTVSLALSPGTIPAPLAVLVKGVCKSMLMEKVRLILLTLAVLTATSLGVGLLTYRAPAGEPAVPVPLPPLPLAVPPVAEAGAPNGSFTLKTDNFKITAPTRRIATLIGAEAERQRKALALLWLGKEMPKWPQPCPVRIKISLNGTGGATSFAFDNGKILSMDMHLEGTLERILASCLPHEVAHTVFAHYFRCPVPRWADEGGAILAEDQQELERHLKLAREILKTPGRAMPLRRLLPLKSYPRDVMVLYAEGYAVTRFLVERKDHKTFLQFVKRANKAGWDEALKEHYSYENLEELEQAWLASLKEKPSKEPPATTELPETEAEAKSVLPSSPQPTTTLAVLDDEERRVRIRVPVIYYEPVTTYVQRGSEAVPVTTYRQARKDGQLSLDLKEAQAFGTDGKPISLEQLRKRLRKETPVLLAQDGHKVDPFYLQVVKEGTMILVVPAPRLPPQGGANPPPTQLAPPAIQTSPDPRTP